MNRRHFLRRTSASVGLAGFASVAAGAKAKDITALADADYSAQIELLSSGQISSAELTAAALERTAKVNGEINAVVHVSEAATPAESGPLKGIPYLIKDLSDVQGMPTTFGSRAFMQYMPAEDTPIVASLRKNGATFIGKTNTPEFGLIGTTESLALGPCRNPWHTGHSSGGSSGGAAAAVAAGIVPAAQASDGGGSIRIPASCCGLVGLKPSRGRMFGEGNDTSPTNISVRHAVSQTVRDQALLLYLTQARGGAANLAPVELVTAPLSKPLKIAFSTLSARGNQPDPDVKAALENTAKLCAQLGHEVVEKTPSYDGELFENRFIDLWASGALGIRKNLEAQGVSGSALNDVLEPWTLYLAEHAERLDDDAIPKVIEHFLSVQSIVSGFMEDVDVWLTPVLAKAPIEIGNQAPNVDVTTLLERTFEYVAYTPLANALGVPAISMPLGWNEAGLPIGSMFTARRGEDELLLRLAYQLEEAQPWRGRKPQVWAG